MDIGKGNLGPNAEWAVKFENGKIVATESVDVKVAAFAAIDQLEAAYPQAKFLLEILKTSIAALG